MDSLQSYNIKSEPINDGVMDFDVFNQPVSVNSETLVINILDESGNPTNEYLKTELVTIIKQDFTQFFENDKNLEPNASTKLENFNLLATDENHSSQSDDTTSSEVLGFNDNSNLSVNSYNMDDKRITNNRREMTRASNKLINTLELEIFAKDDLSPKVSNNSNSETNTKENIFPVFPITNNSNKELNVEQNISSPDPDLNISKKPEKTAKKRVLVSNNTSCDHFVSTPQKISKLKTSKIRPKKLTISGKTFELKNVQINLKKLSVDALLQSNKTDKTIANTKKTNLVLQCNKNNISTLKEIVDDKRIEKIIQKNNEGLECWICYKQIYDIGISEHIDLCKKNYNFCGYCPFKTKYKKNLIGHVIRHLKTFEAQLNKKDDSNTVSINNTQKKPQCKNQKRDLTKAYIRYCQECDKTYSSLTMMSNCLNCHARLLFQCINCNFKNILYNVVRYHILTQCEPDFTETKCSKCGKEFVSYYKMNQHATRYCGVEPKFNCLSCPYKAKDNYKLKRHIQSVHNKAKTSEEGSLSAYIQPWIKRFCKSCKKSIKWNDRIRNISICTKCKTKFVFKCMKCKKQLLSYNSIILHLKKICLCKTNFACKKCKKNVKGFTNLECHIKKCNSKYFCQHCSYNTISKLNLIKHMRLHIEIRN